MLDKELEDALERIRTERRHQLEFLIVVILVGIALNLIASLIWQSVQNLNVGAQYTIVIGAVALCLLLAIFGIYFNPGRIEIHRYFCTCYFLPTPHGEERDAIIHNTLSAGPFLKLIGKYLDWAELHPPQSDPEFYTFQSLASLLAIDPLLKEFNFKWGHHFELSDGFKILREDEHVFGYRQEKLGGQMLTLKEIWHTWLNDDTRALFKNAEVITFPFATLKLPPRTRVETEFDGSEHKLVIKNRFMKISISSSIVIFGAKEEQLLDHLDVIFTCRVSNRLLSRFLPHFLEYFIWSRRILKGFATYFPTEHATISTASSQETDSSFFLVVGHNQTRKFLVYEPDKESNNWEQISDIPLSMRIFFSSPDVAEREGFTLADH